jgi:hypothetical protein
MLNLNRRFNSKIAAQEILLFQTISDKKAGYDASTYFLKSTSTTLSKVSKPVVLNV